MSVMAWMRKVQGALHECAESIRLAEKRKKDQHTPNLSPKEIRAVVSFSDETVRDAKAENGRAHSTQESIKKATWAAVVAASVYALVAAYQAHLTVRQIRYSTDSFRIDERAWVEIEPIKPIPLGAEDARFSATFACNIYAKNVGKTVARDISVKATDLFGAEEMGDNAEEMRNAQDKFLVNKFKESATGNPVIVPSNPIPKVLAPNAVSPVPFRLSCQAPQVFSGGHQSMHYMVGRIDYCDQFQIRHWLKFCFYVVNARGEVWACKEGNDEDRNNETQTLKTACGTPN